MSAWCPMRISRLSATPLWPPKSLPKQMKPQQLLLEAAAFRRAVQAHAQCAKMTLPTITAIAVAIASSVVLTLSGCASSAGIAPVAQPVAPAAVGLDAAPTAA